MLAFSIALVILGAMCLYGFLKHLEFQGLRREYLESINQLSLRLDEVLAQPSIAEQNITLLQSRISNLELSMGMVRR